MNFRVTGHLHHSAPPPPPLGRLAANAARALGRVVVQAMRGGPIRRDPATVSTLQSICRTNDCGYYVSATDRCHHPTCGCYLRAKPWLTTEHCPMNRW